MTTLAAYAQILMPQKQQRRRVENDTEGTQTYRRVASSGATDGVLISFQIAPSGKL